jgi:hypothetical protein
MRLVIYHVLGVSLPEDALDEVLLVNQDIFLGYDRGVEPEEVKEDRYIPFDPANTTYTHLITAIANYVDVLDQPCIQVFFVRDTI